MFCSYEETEGIVILEALACATPTLVRDIPAYRGWLRDSVNVHTYRTTQGLPTRLQALLQHKLPRYCRSRPPNRRGAGITPYWSTIIGII